MAYSFIAQIMIEGAKEDSAPTEDQIKKKAKSIANELLLDSLDTAFDDVLRHQIKAKVRKIIFEVLEEESKLLPFPKEYL